MVRLFIVLLGVFLTSGLAQAHFIWVIPSPKGDSAAAVYSDSPRLDGGEPLKIFPSTSCPIRFPLLRRCLAAAFTSADMRPCMLLVCQRNSAFIRVQGCAAGLVNQAHALVGPFPTPQLGILILGLPWPHLPFTSLKPSQLHSLPQPVPLAARSPRAPGPSRGSPVGGPPGKRPWPLSASRKCLPA